MALLTGLPDYEEIDMGHYRPWYAGIPIYENPMLDQVELSWIDKVLAWNPCNPWGPKPSPAYMFVDPSKPDGDMSVAMIMSSVSIRALRDSISCADRQRFLRGEFINV